MSAKRFLGTYLYETTSAEAQVLRDMPGMYLREVVWASDYEALERQLATLPPAMTWTREKPTAPGWYWYRGVGVLAIVEVCWHTSVIRSHLRAFFVTGRQGHIDDLGGEWVGPMEPPQ